MIHKEVGIFETLYVAVLDNGVLICVQGEKAIGSDGKIYVHVGKENAEGILETVGWKCKE